MFHQYSSELKFNFFDRQNAVFSSFAGFETESFGLVSHAIFLSIFSYRVPVYNIEHLVTPPKSLRTVISIDASNPVEHFHFMSRSR